MNGLNQLGPRWQCLRYQPAWLLYAALVCAAVPLHGQRELGPSNSTGVDQPIQLQGKVVAQGKYQFEVLAEGQKYVVRLAEDAPVALTLRRPFFDWQQRKVFVVAADAAADGGETDGSSPKIGIRIPAGQLYLISRFRTADQMQRIMEAPEKRINYYLISPQPMVDHLPNEEELYIAGKLMPQENRPQLAIGNQQFDVRLGFRTATMSGYHIGDLRAGRVQVTLSGRQDATTGDVLATSVAFEPLAEVGTGGQATSVTAGRAPQ